MLKISVSHSGTHQHQQHGWSKQCYSGADALLREPCTSCCSRLSMPSRAGMVMRFTEFLTALAFPSSAQRPRSWLSSAATCAHSCMAQTLHLERPDVYAEQQCVRSPIDIVLKVPQLWSKDVRHTSCNT